MISNYSKRVWDGEKEWEEWICEDCGKIYMNQMSWYNHRKDHHIDAGNWKCHMCEETVFNQNNKSVNEFYKTKAKLKLHIKEVHSKRPCHICGKVFGENQMKRHMLQVHTENDKKPCICSICNKGFINKFRLENHMNTHTGNKPYLCQHCGKRFANHRNMNPHIRAHNGFKRSQRNRGNSGKTDFTQREKIQLI